MADNEHQKKLPDKKLYHPQPRRNPHSTPRPPPGVEKALRNFGVPDLRELLNNRHKEECSNQEPANVKHNLPPPDPAYNYLKDPIREASPVQDEALLTRQGNQRRSRRGQPNDHANNQRDLTRETSPIHDEGLAPKQGNHRRPRRGQPNDHNYLRDPTRENLSTQNEVLSPKQDNPRKPRRGEANAIKAQANTPDAINRENENLPKDTIKKELRFSDSPQVLNEEPAVPPQLSRRGRGFKGQNHRGNGRHHTPHSNNEEKIENPLNIRVKLSVDSGERSCTLVEGTKIADIKHVPDWTSGGQKGFRGRRGGSFRGGRRRGRGNFQGKRFNDNKTISSDSDAPSLDRAEQPEDQEHDSNRQDSTEQEEFVDSSENYEDFPSEYNEAAGPNEEASRSFESSPESESYQEDKSTSQQPFNSQLAKNITITSSKFQDGEVKRSIEVSEDTENGTNVVSSSEEQKAS